MSQSNDEAMTDAELRTEIAALAEKIVADGVRTGRVIATAESCTGGLVAAAVTDIPGASSVLDRGFVTYSNDAKTEMLGVAEPLIADHGAVSDPVARAMAEGALARSAGGFAVGITGVAGPGGTPAKPEGRVNFALAARDGETLSEQHDFGAVGRGRVRLLAAKRALELLSSAIDG